MADTSLKYASLLIHISFKSNSANGGLLFQKLFCLFLGKTLACSLAIACSLARKQDAKELVFLTAILSPNRDVHAANPHFHAVF